jgi:predicted RNase H-like nuclease (RuvC/YqgF family)
MLAEQNQQRENLIKELDGRVHQLNEENDILKYQITTLPEIRDELFKCNKELNDCFDESAKRERLIHELQKDIAKLTYENKKLELIRLTLEL